MIHDIEHMYIVLFQIYQAQVLKVCRTPDPKACLKDVLENLQKTKGNIRNYIDLGSPI